MAGFIFYEKSSRFAENKLSKMHLDVLPKRIKRVGVFVNSDLTYVQEMQQKYALDYLQLHGDETPEYCSKLKKQNKQIIKVFSPDISFDFRKLEAFQSCCNYFLFDTKGPLKGGNGIAFNWEILQNYRLNKPFLLSGGLGPENIDEALKIRHPQLAGFDLNSKLETEPAVKSIKLSSQTIRKIRKYECC
jgi:phosphoribosylanthranilate isomerase